MDIDIILIGILIVSTLTGLTTEAVKTLLDEYNKSYHANMLAGCISLIISVIVAICYILVTSTPISGELIASIITLVFLSWLCAMVGYDKVIQSISQFKSKE